MPSCRITRPIGIPIVLVLLVQVISTPAANSQNSAPRDSQHTAFRARTFSHGRPRPATDWSKAMVESTIKRYSNPVDLGSWGYAKSLYLYGQYLVWKRTGDDRYLQYIKGWVDSHVDADGNVDSRFNSLDSMLPGNLLLILAQRTTDTRYKIAAEKIRRRFDTYPRTKDRGFWHADTASRQWQLWGDGVFMFMPSSFDMASCSAIADMQTTKRQSSCLCMPVI